MWILNDLGLTSGKIETISQLGLSNLKKKAIIRVFSDWCSSEGEEEVFKKSFYCLRIGWGKTSMVGQSESDDIFVSELKAKELMITG